MKSAGILILLSALLICLASCNTVNDEVFGPGGVDPPDSSGFYSVTASGITLRYKIEDSSLHCQLSAPTSGWVAVGFNPSSMMLNANLIIGYVQENSAHIRDDWGISNTQHSADISLGGTSDVTLLGGSEASGISELEFLIPLNSGDQYDQIMIAGESYPIILAMGSADDFTSFHSAAAFASINLNEEGNGADESFTSGGDISNDDDTSGFNEVSSDDFSLRWKVIGDSLRCMLRAQTSGWVAVGFDPEEDMDQANLIIGYVRENTTYVRDDWGTSETAHAADTDLGGVNNVTRVFGRQEGSFTEIRFTIPLNSGDIFDKILIPGQSYNIIVARGLNNADNFDSMHTATEDFEIEL